MPNKLPTPGQDSGNWGTMLNGFLTQSLDNSNGGGINKFEQFSQRPTNLTADDKGKTYLYTQTGNFHQWTGTEWKVLNEAIINVKDYGAIGDGTTDDTAAIQAAVSGSGRRVYIPAGTYLCNITVAQKIIIEGAGSTASILKPYNSATATVTYASAAPYWTYHSEIRGIGFQGVGTKTGIGFTFAKTNPADFGGIDQYVCNVKFFGCYFYNLDKGVQFPFGNIGSEFYSCGFNSNRYGIYSLNNKFGGDRMHGGNKYFYAGEISGNDCGVYVHNAIEGGGISFTDTIFEYNKISAYIYSNVCINPYTWNNCWCEENAKGGGTVTIDNWSGSTKSTQTVENRSLIFDGDGGYYVFNSTFITDVNVLGSNIKVVANDCRVESTSGFLSNIFSVAQPTSSSIELRNPFGNTLAKNDAVLITGSPKSYYPTLNANATSSANRWFIAPPRSSKVSNYGSSKVTVNPLTTSATTGNGSFGLTGTIVSDGQIYASCNEFTRPAFSSSEYTSLTGSNITTTSGWYIFTVDLKVVAGNPVVYIWDRNTAQLATGMTVPKLNKWYTLTAMAYSAGSQNLYLDFGGNNATCTWRVSAYQMHRFDTQQEGSNFLASSVFVES